MNNIRTRRLSHGLTQAELAARVGKTVRTINRWEQGNLKKPLDRNNLEALAVALNCSVEELAMAGNVPPNKPDLREAPPQSFHGPLRRKGVYVYTVLTDVVLGAGISAGRQIYVDHTVKGTTDVLAGQVVVLKATPSGILLLRQFLPPSLVTTNRDANNEAYRLDEMGLTLVGVVMDDADDPD